MDAAVLHATSSHVDSGAAAIGPAPSRQDATRGRRKDCRGSYSRRQPLLRCRPAWSQGIPSSSLLGCHDCRLAGGIGAPDRIKTRLDANGRLAHDLPRCGHSARNHDCPSDLSFGNTPSACRFYLDLFGCEVVPRRPGIGAHLGGPLLAGSCFVWACARSNADTHEADFALASIGGSGPRVRPTSSPLQENSEATRYWNGGRRRSTRGGASNSANRAHG